MTTIISLAARDFIVIGCDSLATTSRPLLAPRVVEDEFFDASGDLLFDSSGKPKLAKASQLWKLVTQYPVDQLPSVTKAFALGKKAALLFAGASRIGNITIKNLVGLFMDSKEFSSLKSIDALSKGLVDFIKAIYQAEVPTDFNRPGMEIILSGYSEGCRNPEVFRLNFYYDWSASTFVSEAVSEVKAGDYKVVFGGQYDVIQRVVTGVDLNTFVNLQMRGWEMLRSYRDEIVAKVKSDGYTGTVPDIDENEDRYSVFGGMLKGVSRMNFDEGSLSEQAGIDFVAFLINTMIRAQEFSSSIPTVGGEVHIGMLSASHELKWISPEQYRFQDHRTPKIHDVRGF